KWSTPGLGAPRTDVVTPQPLAARDAGANEAAADEVLEQLHARRQRLANRRDVDLADAVEIGELGVDPLQRAQPVGQLRLPKAGVLAQPRDARRIGGALAGGLALDLVVVAVDLL